MLMLMGTTTRQRRGLAGLFDDGTFLGDLFAGEAPGPDDPATIEMPSGGTYEACPAGTMRQWFTNACIPEPPATGAPTKTPNTPTDYGAILANALNAINTGFFPKPGGNTTVTVPTPVAATPTPWYKTTGGMVAIAAGVAAAAYYATTRTKTGKAA